MRMIWEKWNRILFWVAIVLIVIGYVIMSYGDRTLSVIILILSYGLLVPLAYTLTIPKKKKTEE